MSEQKFLFDTYAILEIIDGNPLYLKYIDSEIVINDFIFAELCYKLIREKAPNQDSYLKKHAPFIVHAESEVIKEAMQFRIDNLRKNLSMTDCISYCLANRLGIKFLTGDKEFEGMENVEFVK